MTRRLEGRNALITGGSGGLGSATVRAFVEEGVQGLGISYHTNQARADELVASAVQAGSRAVALRCNATHREDAFQLVEGAVEALGGLDTLVCYAGHPFRRDEWFAPFEELTEEVLLKPLHVDLLGSLFVAQAAIPHLRDSGRGRIVFTASTPAVSGDVVGISYLLAKGALLSLTRSLAWYLGRDKVQVNALVLGSIDTHAMAGLTPEERQALADETALKRFADPEEVARKAAYLASDEASFQTGTGLVVDGGFLMR
ncbi:MAG: SDR family NAD(P)-dependent oxidoreductase [Thermoplasmata archaeon]|nr:SDR family NAD(P)-dependent oxidoreductase [Thermoplasmata archaeon]